jgi:hypothetical protein
MLLLVLAACSGAPAVQIDTPASGASLVTGEPVTFVATVHDDSPLDELRYVFSAEPGGALDGELTVGDETVTLVYTRALLPGAVTVTLVATDPGGLIGRDAVDVLVGENQAPTVEILAPATGARVPAGVEQTVSIQVADADEADPGALSLAWTGLDGPEHPDAAGTAAATATFTTIGAAAVSVSVTDSAGAIDVADLTLEVYDADDDNDGWPDVADGGTDCDDADPAVSPAADELCDGIDQDCNGVVDDGPSDGATWYADTDGDGYGAEPGTASCAAPAGWIATGGDCDDADAGVHVGAVETCDGRDEDCDGSVDEDVTDAPTWYADADGDGYGDDTVTSVACVASAGEVATGGDCDDADATVNPGATETCDAADRDEDCDGLADDADAAPAGRSTWYADRDADGYGLAGSTRAACDMPAGYVGDATDCDDHDATSFPGATEVCEDGADNDCDGRDVTCALAGVIDLSAADAKWTGAAGNDFAGACDWAGDVDGDGLDDVVIGAWGHTGGGATSGAVYIVAADGMGTTSLASATASRTGVAASDVAGFAVAGAGDLDGDGYADVLVGAYGTDAGGSGAGGAYLLSGPMSGTASLSTADATLVGEVGGDAAGWAVAPAGDTDGDGNPEVLVGATGQDGGGALAGAAYLLEGPLAGTIDLSAADATLDGESAGDEAGYAVGPAGDVDGDGFDDVIIGGIAGNVGTAAPGVAWIVLGPVTGALDLGAADARLEGDADGDDAGASVWTAGDTDGDGYADVIVGAPLYDGPGSESGAAYLVRGPISGTSSLSTADAVFTGESAQDRAGWAVRGGGDADADGFADVVIGAYYDNAGGTGSGTSYLVYGPVSGTVGLGSADASFVGESARDASGKSVAIGGDGDGDGFDDMLVGATGEASSAAGAGAVYLVRGGGG